MSEPVVRFRSRRLQKGRILADGRRVRAGTVVRDCWLEDTVADGWMVAYRLVPQGGRPVLAEVRVYPGTPDTYATPGEWSAEWEGHMVPVPVGGITARLLKHRLRPGTYLAHFAEIIRKMEKNWGRSALYDGEQLLGRHGFSPGSSQAETNVGRPTPHNLLFCAKVARDLNRIINQGNAKAPVQQLAEEMGYEPVARMYRLVRRAREKGMLEGARDGLSGGRLTDRAKALLRAAGEEEE